MYNKPAPQGSGNGWSGWYKDWYFRSINELSFMINFIEKENHEWIPCENAIYSIPYYFLNKELNYFADFIIDNKLLVEIKPYKLINTPKVLAKKEGALIWCQNHGLEYKIFTEKDFNKIKFEELEILVNTGIVKFTKRYYQKYEQFRKIQKQINCP